LIPQILPSIRELCTHTERTCQSKKPGRMAAEKGVGDDRPCWRRDESAIVQFDRHGEGPSEIWHTYLGEPMKMARLV
jgi:hypothetical protein